MASSAAPESGGRGGGWSARPAPRLSSGGDVAAICCKVPRRAGKLRALVVRQRVQDGTAHDTDSDRTLHLQRHGGFVDV
jgi:hypothetical protein